MTAGARPGLRERKKQETRTALSHATIRLSVERGWGNVTIDDIADAADVSVRTFRNYFSSKAEAVAAVHLDRMLRIADELRDRPAAEPLWDAITSAVVAQFATPQDSPARDQRWGDAVRIFLSEPTVQAAVYRTVVTAQAAIAAAISKRTGTTGLYPTLVATVIGSTTGVAVEHCLRADPPVPLVPVLRDALVQVAAGLPVPGESA